MPAGEIPDQPGVDRAEERITLLGIRSKSRSIIKKPAQFRAGEIGCQREPGYRAKPIYAITFGQLVANLFRARVLPDDRVGVWFAGMAIPNQRGFALIGDSDGADVTWRDTVADLPDHLLRAHPDFARIVFNPAGLGENLLMLVLRDPNNRLAIK